MIQARVELILPDPLDSNTAVVVRSCRAAIHEYVRQRIALHRLGCNGIEAVARR